MSNPQWYNYFNTKFNISESIGVTRQHKALLEYVAQEAHSLEFDACTEDQKEDVGIDAEECYLSYTLLRQSGTQHSKLKADLQN